MVEYILRFLNTIRHKCFWGKRLLYTFETEIIKPNGYLYKTKTHQVNSEHKTQGEAVS